MLSKVKLALRIVADEFNSEILDLIAAAVADIRVVGAVFSADEVKVEGVVTDYSVPDPLVQRAIITYCKLHFGECDQYDRLKASYDEQKAQMRENSNYKESTNG